jgi:hypothetical protein
MFEIRFGCPQAAIYRLKQTLTLTQATPFVKRVGPEYSTRFQPRGVFPFKRQATKQPLPLTKAFEREAARQTRSLCLAVNRLVSGKEAL